MSKHSKSDLNKREIEIRVIFLRVGEIDTLNEKFFAEILIEAKWEEPELSTEFDLSPNKLHFNEEKELNNINRFWNPKIYIENALNDPKQNTHYKAKKELVRSEPKKNADSLEELNFKFWIFEYRKIKGFFFEKLELYYFPVDVQDLGIIVTTYRSNKEVTLIPNKKKPSIVNSNLTIDQNIWHLYQHVEVKTNYDFESFDTNLNADDNLDENEFKMIETEMQNNSSIRFPVIMFQCRAARRSGYFFWNAFFLIFLITTAVFTTFSIEFDKPHFRLPTTATLLLTSITFRWSYSSRCLPTVNYLTSLDKYSIISLFLIYLTLMWHGISMFLFNKLNVVTVKSLDKIFLFFLIMIYLSCHIILFIWLKSAYSIRNLMKEKDYKLYKQEPNKSSDLFVSNDTVSNVIENDKLSIYGSKRQSLFSTINNIDEINSGRKKAMINNFKNKLTNLKEEKI